MRNFFTFSKIRILAYEENFKKIRLRICCHSIKIAYIILYLNNVTDISKLAHLSFDTKFRSSWK